MSPRMKPPDPPEDQFSYVDASGPSTDDPAVVASGEIIQYDIHGARLGRTRFFLGRSDLPWLPVSEAAFLLWVLAAMILLWACIGIVLGFT